MVRTELLRAAAGLVLFLVQAAGSASAEEQEWRLVVAASPALDERGPAAPQVSLAGFLDATHGIALCRHGTLLWTEDAGRSWRRASHPPFAADLEGLEILDRRKAWASGGVFILRSEDGGKSWKALPNHGPMYPEGRHLSFADARVGWYATARELHATRDGGLDWMPLVLPEEAAGEIAAVHLLSEQVGFVLLYSGALLATRDGGRSWDRKPVPLEGGRPQGLLPEMPVEAVRFRDRMQGVLVLYAERPKRGFYVLATSDGGTTWKDEQLPPTGVTLGSVFLSRDGRHLTVNDLDRNRILVLERAPASLP